MVLLFVCVIELPFFVSFVYALYEHKKSIGEVQGELPAPIPSTAWSSGLDFPRAAKQQLRHAGQSATNDGSTLFKWWSWG